MFTSQEMLATWAKLPTCGDVSATSIRFYLIEQVRFYSQTTSPLQLSNKHFLGLLSVLFPVAIKKKQMEAAETSPHVKNIPVCYLSTV
ncbi:hypothetical protein EGR_11233 [Echinococcus granulosus]|uniref:Uncharacterized protein n=1 Tax=Echinococcus granulosus TaxID=6210 RepID=W6TYQ2_ECHGR|nr:hypothetical protein EGR_11233 [Echinococcus granulosus]EUB53910.1 hypothetical protein EGR_11233 [Echinococcus granulosus]